MSEEIAFVRHEERAIDPAQIRRLYLSATWGHDRDEAGIVEVLSAGPAVGAWHGDRLVGFTRALTDGRYRAYIEDVIIDPEYRGRGIGEQMVAKLVEDLAPIQIVSLFCEPERVPFYGRNGFEASKTQVMMHRGSESNVS